MTMWMPVLKDEVPRYRALADAIARDLAEGRLIPGDRLPTHRELAQVLGVTVGTVSRGYAEAERRGLTSGEIGRGTFLRASPAFEPWPQQSRQTGIVDLSLSLPVMVGEEGAALADTLRRIAEEAGPEELLTYCPESANSHQRTVAARWLERLGLPARADEVLVTGGNQHGLNVVLSTVFRSGQVILTGALTYPSIKSQARAYGIRLRGVELDDQGVCPDAVERACRLEPRPAGLYLVPTIQNPTSAVMSEARRRSLARIAKCHGLWIIEDDVHAFLPSDSPAPIATYAPEQTIYLSSLAKCLVPGLRTGFLMAPAALRTRLRSGIHTSIWMPPPLMVEVTTRWLAEGIADRLIHAKRQELEHRQRLAQKILGSYRPRSHPSGYQLWLTLPEPWHTDEFVAQARQQGVIVVGAGAFAVSRSNVPQAVRLSIGVPCRPDLERGLSILDQILTGLAAPIY